ncbi:hypothetical protein GOBAR_DD24835 [Gossypium barbadense]|nr:hypothetical protein GOBAR_DD24835 [Gossypium barbadense]
MVHRLSVPCKTSRKKRGIESNLGKFRIQRLISIPLRTLPLRCHLNTQTAASYLESLNNFTRESLMQLALHGPDFTECRSV